MDSLAQEYGRLRDYCMNGPGGQMVAGICHERGEKAAPRPVWMVYIVVADPDESLRRCVEGGGRIRVGPWRWPRYSSRAGSKAATC